MAKLVMGYWDCPFCGSKEIRGDVVNCPSCGRARGDVKFYMEGYTEGETREENERGDVEYLDEEKAKYVSRNPDWYCSFCNSLNGDNAQFCGNCGSSRADSESNYFDQLKKRQEQEAAERSAQPQQQSSAPQKAGGGKKWLLIAAAVVVAIVCLVMYLNGNKTSGDLRVTALSWVRSVQIEEYRQYSESGWNLPDGAELTDKREEIHHYDSVLDHYESRKVERSRRVVDHYETYYTYKDLGNGNFEEVAHERPVYTTEYYTETVQEPVYVKVPRYATKYYYTIWRWTPSRVATASGDDHNPRWPDLNLEEKEREAEQDARSAFYRFTVTDKDGKTFVYHLAEGDWMNINVDDTIQITSKRTGADAYISDEKGNRIADVVLEK